MKPERGQYRSITVALLDGPDFQQLPPEARWVFTCLKIGLGPSGIEVVYPAALVETLAARTGYPAATVAAMLDLLQETGWIRAERNVVWVVKQLEFEPAMTAKNEKHQAAILSHVKGLPRLAIVAEFVRQYQAYLPDWESLLKLYPKPSDSLSVAYGKGNDSPPNHRDRDGIPNSETEEVPTATQSGEARPEEPEHNRNSVLGLVVDRLYFGRRPSEPEMATNASILARFNKAGYSWDKLARAVEGLALRRDRGELKSVPRNQPVSLKWIADKDQLLNQIAVSEDALYRGPPEPTDKKRGGVTDIQSILGRAG